MEKSKKCIIAIAGNIASGKSEVEKILKQKGFKTIEADLIGWEILNNKKVKQKLTSIFGDILTDGKINRKKLGRIVFSDSEKLNQLDTIVHPMLLRKLKKYINNSQEKIVVVVAALIFEWGIEDWFDKIVLVVSLKRKRIERLLRNGLSREEANNRIQSQIDDKKVKEKSDFIIENNGTISELTKKTLKIIKSVCDSNKPKLPEVSDA